MSKPTLVLSGKQPWFWCMTNLPAKHRKMVENRRRKDGRTPSIVRHRGPILLHASAECPRRYYADAVAWIAQYVGHDVAAMIPPRGELPRGGIVGRALAVAHLEPTGAVRTHPTDPDAAGPYADRIPEGLDFNWQMDESYGLVLADAEPIPLIPCGGLLCLWTPRCQHLHCPPTGAARADAVPRVATHYSFADHPDVKRHLLCEHHAEQVDPPYKTALLVPEDWGKR